MSESDDDAGIPLHPTARKPAFTPSKDYLQYLDLGGELAQLGSLKDQRALKAAVLAMKNRTISVLPANGMRRLVTKTRVKRRNTSTIGFAAKLINTLTSMLVQRPSSNSRSKWSKR